ncbi:MAG: sodium-dependent transporter [Myxococcales bacterium]|nr:sodium-dependent transporter [Myxococcales bacterium]
MADSGKTQGRGAWGSKLGFTLAAAGSAVGLGNIWKFPYITGENGGGLFVLIYLLCIAVIGVPIMIAEIMIGRRAQRAPVDAITKLTGRENTAWSMVGWMGVVAGFIILSFYSVVAGWSMNYGLMSIGRVFQDKTPEEIQSLFGVLFTSGGINLFWHLAFMLIVVLIVKSGIQGGIERWSTRLMPVLFLMMGVLVVDAMFQDGFGEAVNFVFGFHTDKLTSKGVLEALGHSFFTLSLGMGAMLTYGSYLGKKDDIVKSSIAISLLDTGVALMACLVMFPIIFSFGMSEQAGPGLVFVSMPIAFSQMPGGLLLSILFFFLLFFAALTSAVSLLEVVVATVIDQLGWTRKRAVFVMGSAIFLFGVPSALSGVEWFSSNWEALFGRNFFDTFDYLASNWLLPLGGLMIALFVGWAVPKEVAAAEFSAEQDGELEGGRLVLFKVWHITLKFVVPLAVLLLFLYSVGVITEDMLPGVASE